MTPRERARTRHFALALDTRALDMRARGAAGDDVALAPLLRLTEALGAAGGGAIAPTDAFRQALRNRILAVGAVSTRPAGGISQPAPWRRRLVAVSAALAVTTGGAAATAVASTNALPGDTLYDVKRAVEQVQLALAPTELAKGERYLAIASTRLAEVQAMLEGNVAGVADPVLVDELRATMAAMSDAVASGSERFFAVFERTGDASVLAPLEEFLAQRSLGLSEVSGLLPVELIGSQTSLVGELDGLAERLAVVTGKDPVTTLARAATARSLTTPSAPAPVAASRSAGRGGFVLLFTPESTLQQLTDSVRAAAVAAEREVAQAAEASSPERQSGHSERVERSVRRLVEVNVIGRDGAVDEANVEVFPGSESATRAGTGSMRSTSAGSAGSSSSRLLSMLPMGTPSAFDAVIPGSLTASFDLAAGRLGSAKYAHLQAD